MKALYINEHISCPNYVDSGKSGFARYNLKANETFEVKDRDVNCLFFFLSGNVELTCELFDYRIYKEETMVLFSKDTNVSGKAITDAEFMILLFDRHTNICDKVLLETLYAQYPNQKSNYLGLNIVPAMKHVLDSVNFYLENKLQCSHLHALKTQEAFFIFRGFYNKQEIVSFFEPILNKTVHFKDFVIRNYHRVKTVEELSDLYGCSLRSFNRKFKEYFDDSPYNWMLKQKARHVRGYILNPDIPFSNIIKEFKFSSPSHFSTYCKKQFGITPRDMRKRGMDATKKRH